MQGLIGKKVGMTQIFDKDGRRVAVTVVQVGPCVVVQKKSVEKDGYSAVQLGYGEHKEKGVPKAAINRFKKIGTGPRMWLREFSIDAGEEVKEGDVVKVDIFAEGSYVDVTGTTKGRGFQGVMRRHEMRGGPMTHGGHSKRRIGSNGQNAFPARVLKGKRMPGHMGNVRMTQQNLKVEKVRADENIMLINGAIPGPNGSVVMVKKALKKPSEKAK
jgi:large subunit ribosomal protein L3